MKPLTKNERMNALQQFIQSKPCGFLKDSDMPQLIALDRLIPVLVRCGYGRFTCAAQDAAHFIKCVESGGDYVRDVSFPVGSMEKAASWVQEPSIAKCCHNASATKSAGLLSQKKDLRRVRHDFNEADCGGVFDGFGVVSDADPGL